MYVMEYWKNDISLCLCTVRNLHCSLIFKAQKLLLYSVPELLDGYFKYRYASAVNEYQNKREFTGEIRN